MTPSVSGGKFNDTRSAKSDGIKVEYTGDKTRDKCTELIYDALVFDSGAPSELILNRAKDIEKNVLNDNGGTTAAYKAKIRSLFVNLKDKNNPGLRESVISGDLPVSRFCKMSSQVRSIGFISLSWAPARLAICGTSWGDCRAHTV